MLNYKEELTNRKKKIKAELKAHEELLTKNVFNSPEWWKLYKKINSLKIDLETANSRIENLGKTKGIEPYRINNDVLQKLNFY